MYIRNAFEAYLQKKTVAELQAMLDAPDVSSRHEAFITFELGRRDQTKLPRGKRTAALARYRVGDHLSNEEILDLLSLYTQVAEGSAQLGPEFYLAFVEAHRHQLALTEYAKARGILKEK